MPMHEKGSFTHPLDAGRLTATLEYRVTPPVYRANPPSYPVRSGPIGPQTHRELTESAQRTHRKMGRCRPHAQAESSSPLPGLPEGVGSEPDEMGIG